MDWPARIAAFAEAVDAEVRIIAYVRPQYQMLESTYSQRTQTRRNLKSFEVFKAEYLASGELDWNTTFEPWRKTFGPASLIVTPLERSRVGEDIRLHFLRQLGERDPPQLPRWPPLGVRVGAKLLEVNRMAGMALQAAGRNPREVKILRSCNMAPVIRRDEPFAALSAEEVGAVTELFAASNARFARDYGIDADGVLFREPGPDRHRRPNQASWTDLSAGERRRARLLALDRLGIDIAPQEPAATGLRQGIDRAQTWFINRRHHFRSRYRDLLRWQPPTEDPAACGVARQVTALPSGWDVAPSGQPPRRQHEQPGHALANPAERPTPGRAGSNPRKPHRLKRLCAGSQVRARHSASGSVQTGAQPR